MPRDVYLIKVGMTMTEGMVSEWYIADGQQVNKGEMLYALETEKVNLDVDAEASGTVKHLVQTGINMEPGVVVGYIFEAGEEIPSDLGALSSGAAESVATDRIDSAANDSVVDGQETDQPQSADNLVPGRIKSSPAARRLGRELGVDLKRVKGTGPGGRIIEADVQGAKDKTPKASPLAKRLAAEKGVDLFEVKGTGPGGRIVQADIEAAAAAAITTLAPSIVSESIGAGTVVSAREEIRVPVRGIRKIIARRMISSLQNSAQLTMDMEVVMDDAVKLRESLIEEWRQQDIRPTYTDLVVRAVAKALGKHPQMNSQFGETEITLLAEINVGIAVALPEGLVVPVVRHADNLSVKELAVESARLASAARAGTLGLDDYAGGTFTVTALGMYGVDSFTPIINEPQAGILGVNRIYDGVEWHGDTAVRTKKMNLSLTWDHRVIDGAPAAEFLAEVRDLLSNPFRLLV